MATQFRSTSAPQNTTPNSMQVPNTPAGGGPNKAESPSVPESNGGWNSSGSTPQGGGLQSMYSSTPTPTFRGSRQPIGVGRTIGYGNLPATQMVQQNQRDLAASYSNPMAPTYQAAGIDPRMANNPFGYLHLGVARGTMSPQQAQSIYAQSPQGQAQARELQQAQQAQQQREMLLQQAQEQSASQIGRRVNPTALSSQEGLYQEGPRRPRFDQQVQSERPPVPGSPLMDLYQDRMNRVGDDPSLRAMPLRGMY